jgi:tRNA 2-selenouridine synthase
MFQDISIEPIEITLEQLRELQNKQHLTLIDVRSPDEYADSTIPSSINIAIFDNEERKRIGTLYKQESAQAATEKGFEIFSAKLPELVKQYEQFPHEKVVFCWRGGMRSKASATMLSLMGIKCYRLKGGYRAYRRWVVEQLEYYEFKPKCIVLNGLTGSGKTRILHCLTEQGYPVLDFEGMAQHRGSVFGQIGLKPNNQKTFDAELFEKLIQYKETPFVLVEAESKRIGKILIPNFLTNAKEVGVVIFLDMPVAERVRNLIEDYRPNDHKEEFIESFLRIKSKIHTPVAASIEKYLREGQFVEAFTLLLEYYYDPRYEHAADIYPVEFIVRKVENIKEGVEAVKQEIEKFNLK